MNQRMAEETTMRLEADLGSGRAQQLVSEGRALTEQEALALALRQTQARLTPR